MTKNTPESTDFRSAIEAPKPTAAELAEKAKASLSKFPEIAALGNRWEQLPADAKDAFVRFAKASKAAANPNPKPASKPRQPPDPTSRTQTLPQARAAMRLVQEWFNAEADDIRSRSPEENGFAFLVAFAACQFQLPDLSVCVEVIRDEQICQSLRRDASEDARARLSQFHALPRKEIMRIGKNGKAITPQNRAA